jgi:primosomal protein N' (replication factor Y) (superfamily II helicase)
VTLHSGDSTFSEIQADRSARLLPGPRGWVTVLVDCPGAQDRFTYAVPAGLTVQAGDILTVPFGAQQVGGIALEVLAAPPADVPPDHLRNVEAASRFFSAAYWALLQQVADYYCTPLIAVLKAALPPGLLAKSSRRVRVKAEFLAMGDELNALAAVLSPGAQALLTLLRAGKAAGYSTQFVNSKLKGQGINKAMPELLKQGLVERYCEPPQPLRPKLRQVISLVQPAVTVALTDRQDDILGVLRRRGGEMAVTELLQICKTSSSVLKTLETKGCVVIQSREVLRSDQSEVAADQPKVLTSDQAQALDAIQALTGPAQVLLHGVTGSGKTEVYLQAIAPLLAAGRSALVLVPEIGLTPQLTDRFRARFGGQVSLYHSALSEGERYDTWRQMLSGSPQVVIGTRSAIFLPLSNLGLIILDEEHDGSFKQDQPIPCYHARTVAQWRSQLDQCPLILGSATPSLESWVAARDPAADHATHYLSLPRRVADRPLPRIEPIDMRRELQEGNRSIFSRPLQSALKQLKETGQQGLLFIHRRGHSTHVSCRSCGYVMECPHCDVPLAYHHTHADARELLRCHYCGHGSAQPPRCPDCDSTYFKTFGSGTQRVTQELARLFPELRWIRFDSDTTRTKGSHRALLGEFASGGADLLVGTQMLTKGIDLPQVTLVGVVSADGLLHLPDFRASERAYQTLVQVAGRSGRGEEPGRVILQTYTPEHPVIEAVVRQDYAAFVATELTLRRTLQFPPQGQLVLLRFSSPDAAAVERAAQRVAQILQAGEHLPYVMLGPAPAAILRVAERYRWQILLKFPIGVERAELSLVGLRSACPNGVSLSIDVDPLNLL